MFMRSKLKFIQLTYDVNHNCMNLNLDWEHVGSLTLSRDKTIS